LRHHNFAGEKQAIFTEMERAKNILPKISKHVGRPKVDYSKIEKIWIDDYNIKSCLPTDPLLDY